MTGYHLSDKEQNTYVLGLREMSSKSAESTLTIFKDILDDIKDSSTKLPNSDKIGKQILAHISATMSDQAATEKKFNKILEDLKRDILPEVTENWESMSEEARASAQKIINFYCGLHLLVNFAEQVNKIIATYEKDILSQNADSDECSAVKLVRLTCKAFAKGGDEKCGQYKDFSIFCKGRNKPNKMAPFRGNRFNILFYDAEQVFYMQEEVKDFLLDVHGTTNGLLQAISAGVQNDNNLAICKALGLISKQITGPLWRIIEGKGHILDMNPVFEKLQQYFQKMSTDSIPFLHGTDVPFPDDITKDEVYLRLLQHDKADHVSAAILQLIFAGWSTYLSRAVKDHLEGGLHFGMEKDSEYVEKTRSVLKHNKKGFLG